MLGLFSSNGCHAVSLGPDLPASTSGNNSNGVFSLQKRTFMNRKRPTFGLPHHPLYPELATGNETQPDARLATVRLRLNHLPSSPFVIVHNVLAYQNDRTLKTVKYIIVVVTAHVK
jgi:hypothetical protein